MTDHLVLLSLVKQICRFLAGHEAYVWARSKGLPTAPSIESAAKVGERRIMLPCRCLLVVGSSACNGGQLMFLRQHDASLIWKHHSSGVLEACQAWLLLSCICAVLSYAYQLV